MFLVVRIFNNMGILTCMVIVCLSLYGRSFAVTLFNHIQLRVTNDGNNSIDLWTDLESRFFYNESVEYNKTESVSPMLLFQDDNLLLVSCSHVQFNIRRSLMKRCLCYVDGTFENTNVDIHKLSVRQCDATKATNNVTMDIIDKGGWEYAIAFTEREDVDLMIPSTMSHKLFSCDQDPTDIIPVINSMSMLRDYHGVIIDCPIVDALRIIEKLSEDPRVNKHFNWLLIGLEVQDFSVIHDVVRRGDNVVLLESVIRTLPLVKVITDIVVEDNSFVRVNIHWCHMKCDRPNSLLDKGWYAGDMPLLSHLLPSQFQQFYGNNMIVTYAEYRPFCFLVNDTDFTSHLEGLEVNIMNALSEKFNFSYRLVVTDDGKYGSQDPDGTWNGMVGMVNEKRADLAISGISLSLARDTVIDYLHPHWIDPSVVVYKQKYSKWMYFVGPFSWHLWVIIALFPIFVALLIVIIKFLANKYITDYMKHNLPDKDVENRFWADLMDYSLITYGCLMQQGLEFPIRSHSARIVIATFWMTVIILTAVYTGNLTASLAVNIVKAPFNTLAELAEDTSYILSVVDGTVQKQIFEEGSIAVYKKLWSKIQNNIDRGSIASTPDEGMRKVADEEGFVLVGDYTALLSFQRSCASCRDMAIMDEKFSHIGMGIVVPEGMPYVRAFNDVILNLLERGLVDYWYRQFMDTPHVTTSNSIDPVTAKDISLAYMTTIMGGIGISAIVLILEMLVHCCQTNKGVMKIHMKNT